MMNLNKNIDIQNNTWYITSIINASILEEDIMSMLISSQAANAEGSETIERVGHECGRSAQPPKFWGEDIVRSSWKREAVERVFNNYCVVESGCHEWQGGTSHGYGTMRVREVWGSAPVYTHRVSYLLRYGAIERGLNVCHKCDNPICVNPDHLFVGTQIDNLKDMFDKNRNAFGEKNGMVKLNNDSIKKIRDLVISSDVKQFDIAHMFGLSQAQISRIIRGRRRKDAAGSLRAVHGNYKHGRYSAARN